MNAKTNIPALQIIPFSTGGFVIHKITGDFSGKCSAWFNTNGDLIDVEQVANNSSRNVKKNGPIWNYCQGFRNRLNIAWNKTQLNKMSVLIIPDSLCDSEKRAEFILSIERKVQISANCWVKTSDSTIPEERRAEYQAKYEKLTDEVEEMLGMFGIKTEWPGLFPSLILPDGSTEHSIKRAVNSLYEKQVHP